MREIVRGRTCEVIAAQLAEEILSGRIPSGEELRQETVAGLLETSRIPVREALGILESLGLACRLSTRHVTAYCPEEKELSEIFQVWSGLECFVLEDAAVRERLTAYTEKAARWHQALASECKNPYFKKILTDAARYCISYACALVGQEAQENVLREILLAETEQERQRRMRQYFQSLSEHIVRQWKGETEWH